MDSQVLVATLGPNVRACLFDLDGVLTDTARVHAAAWKQMFDTFLATAPGADGPPAPFDRERDYDRYVDGRPRLDGVRSFLASRSITLPEGTAEDAAGTPTVNGLARAKNDLVGTRLRTDGVEVFAGADRLLRAAAEAGIHRAVVSSSANTREVLEITGLGGLIELIVDGNDLSAHDLKGKPAPDTYLYAAGVLGVPVTEAAVFEDALAGVQSGRAGGFATVVGVARHGNEADLREHGATMVIADLRELLE